MRIMLRLSFFKRAVSSASWWTALHVTAISLTGTGLAVVMAGRGMLHILKTDPSFHWELNNTGIENDSVFCLATTGTSLFTGTGRGIVVHVDGEAAWTDATGGVVTGKVNCLAASDRRIVAGTVSRGVFLSDSRGADWRKTTVLSATNCFSVAISGEYIFAGTGEGLYRSVDGGEHWDITAYEYKQHANNKAASIALAGSAVFVGTWGYGAIKCFAR